MIETNGRHNTASEAMKLSRDHRNRILAEQAEQAEVAYRTNRDIKDIEVLGEDDIYDEHPE